jgi:thiamine-phosphate pyrophosphorylase
MTSRRPILYYITDSAQLGPGEALLARIRAAFAAGVDWVQIREKGMPTRELCRLVEQAAALPEKGRARLLVNERLDVALGCGADGVHLPADSLPVAAVRAAAPEGWLVGISCHSPEEVEAAAREGASFAVLGPLFSTPGKSAPLGLEPLREACRRTAARKFPVLALGGVTLENAAACLAAGAAGLAAIRLLQSADVKKVVTQLRRLQANE